MQEKLKEMRNSKIPVSSAMIKKVNAYNCDVRIGESLKIFAASVSSYKKRYIYEVIKNFIYNETHDKVFILYGLRRTGKTTLVRQIIYNMLESNFSKSVFIQINSNNTLSDVNKDLKVLEAKGYKYVFIDEVTLMDDFIDGAALFSDVFATSGMKIVLSGTDSLGFIFSEDEQLYDRCILLHTTFIPFREFYDVLGIQSIDEYIKYGGTMSRSGENYNNLIFGTKQSTDEYVNTAIARNIQHSLKNYQYEDHFRNLYELYEKHELTNVINRIVEDMNHRFTIDVLTRDFKSHDFGLAQRNVRNDRNNPTDILDTVNKPKFLKNLMKALEILNKQNQTVEIKDVHRKEIKEYLDMLDLTCDIPVVSMTDLNNRVFFTVFTQPGLRYSQAESLIKSLMMDDIFKNISAIDRKRITDKILDDVKGRILEEIVLLETKKANPEKDIFKLKFAVGEFDMVVYDSENVNCKIYEIKHSKEISKEQYHHLVDTKKCEQTEFRYGKILSKVVLYRGKNSETEEGILYRNVEEYLLELGKH
ncbi:AAA family ATPase [uncultured Treponema sp.]|uniref:AAA family ATPase n=1 Tax=Treponema sp. TaxID=166 RepID=UPI0025DE8401|nr:AAA family ATPase [uncultured Treponema sp.]